MPPIAYIQDGQHDRWLNFGSAKRVICATGVDQVIPALEEIEHAVDAWGWWAFGFVSYEAAPAFDSALTTRTGSALPLLWFSLHDAPVVSASLPLQQSPTIPNYQWQQTQSQFEYEAAIVEIRDLIAAGDTYQVNYSLRLRTALNESPEALFARIVDANRPRYSAYLDTGEFVICSASPELFFERRGTLITCKPMKGTIGRGWRQADDVRKAQALQNSAKDRAENVMIVDMVRNDLARIARPGSVQVPRLFDVERYPTLWQMTSTVQAQSTAGLTDTMRALFPAASITGAPKARAMAIIAALETTPRGVYTGCIGYVAPDRRAQFNVAIRTVVIDKLTRRLEYGAGGGIVWDSTSAAEYAECLLKARIVTAAPAPFELLETMLWEPDSGYFLLDEHLERLRHSARYLDVTVDLARVRAALVAAIPSFGAGSQRVRLLVDRAGVSTISTEALPTPDCASVVLAIATQPVSRKNPFLYHKTTHRRVYDDARQAQPHGDDVVLWNERGEVTETTVANIVIEKAGRLITPPVDCGLLGGVFRQALLRAGTIEEERVTLGDLRDAARIFVVNSVRRWRSANLITQEDEIS